MSERVQNGDTQCRCASEQCGARDDGHAFHPCGRCVREGARRVTFALYALVATFLLCDECAERRGA